MPLSELELKWTGMNFDVAAEEMRRLKGTPSDDEKLFLYGLYKQAVHGDIPPAEIYPNPSDGGVDAQKYSAWLSQKGKSSQECREAYVKFAEQLIRQYKRNVFRCKWNSEVWTVDY